MRDDPIRLGRLVDLERCRVGDKILYGGERNLLLFGANGTGKGMRVLVPNLLQTTALTSPKSIVVIDPKGELAAITAPFRRSLGPVVIINPFGVLTDIPGYEDLRSDGFNPLASLDPAAPSFNVEASLMVEALMPVGGKDPHWDESARALGASLIMHHAIEARRLGQVPSMARVRELLCMPNEKADESNGHEGKGIPKLALSWMESHVAGLRNKGGQFVNWSREKESIASTAMRHTETFDDPEIADDLARGTFDFAELKRRPCTVYLILPPHMMQRHARWLRLLLTTALTAVMRPRQPGEPRVLFMIDEFAALGHLQIIETVWALVRGYGVQIMPVFQDLNQLKAIYGERCETFIGMAGAVASFGPNDMTTAEWLSRRAGDRTELVASYSYSPTPPQQGPGAAASDPASAGFSFSQVKVPLITPHNLLNLPEGFGLVALAGMGNLLPSFVPAYWKIAECQRRARENPYYRRPGRSSAPAMPHGPRPLPIDWYGAYNPNNGYGLGSGASPINAAVSISRAIS